MKRARYMKLKAELIPTNIPGRVGYTCQVGSYEEVDQTTTSENVSHSPTQVGPGWVLVEVISKKSGECTVSFPGLSWYTNKWVTMSRRALKEVHVDPQTKKVCSTR